MSDRVVRLKRRREFLRVAAARVKAVTPGMVVQAAPRGEPDGREIRVGFTASRKVGKAVARNRARRRLKALAAELLPLYGKAATDYVLIARGETVARPFAALREDLLKALARLDRQPRSEREATT